MNTPIRSWFGRPRLSKSNKGIALILVLGFLVLITGLIVAFFSSVTTELTSATSYASGAGTKQLANSAVGTVMAQIKIATSGSNTAWASQPGMIRTYDDSGKRLACYKLYSSSNMVVATTSSFNPVVDVPSTGWDKQTAFYTDLNAPVITTTGTNYPIVDPRAKLELKVEGFGYNDPNNVSIYDPKDPTPVASGTSANPLPMPVRWLFMLKDGTLTVPDDPTASTSTTATFTGKNIPTTSNPIVGRIAFWTDDESCKLNLNTASEPTPWDMPRALTKQDLQYGYYQPAQKEFQRFPGHPYMNALSPVFFPNPTQATIPDATKQVQAKAIYSLVPRVAWGGSQAGTNPVTSNSIVAPDTDRLFANADEALFAQPLTSGSPRVQNTTTSPALFKNILQRSRFFLTANSRAPEVNLYGQPRVSLWPLDTDPNLRTGYDKLAAFCSTIGSSSSTNTYYFQRHDSTDPKSDYTGISRNQKLYPYLQNLTNKPIPGYGGSFATKWGDDRDQVLTEMFDYIRCVNLRDPQLVKDNKARFADNGQVVPIQIKTPAGVDTQGFGRFHSISQFGLHFICSAQVSTSGTAQGAHDDPNTPKLSAGQSAIEAALLFEPYSPSLGYYELHESISYIVTFKSAMSVDENNLEFPSAPTTVSSTDFGAVWHGRYWGGAQGVRGPIARFGGAGYPFISKRIAVGGAGKTTMSFKGGTVEVKVFAGTTASKLIQTFTITFPPADFPIPQLVKAGTVAYRGTSASAQQDWWTFKPWTGKSGKGVGRYAYAHECPHAPGVEYTDTNRQWGASGGAAGFKRGGVFRAEDVVRTIVPDHGDIRLVAAKSDPSSLFVKGNHYNDTAFRFDHLFTEPQGPHMLFGFSNEPGSPPAGADVIPGSGAEDQLVPSAKVKYHYARVAEIRPGAGKLYNKWNDYDNGFAHMTDGAYINKPDEGNIMTSAQSSSANTRGYAYFSWDFAAPSDIFFSPSRLIPSAGMFGSLPTGVKSNQPWQTLLFRPEVRNGHPGRGEPVTGPPYSKVPDHLIMDLFWMPVIEPYAISEPFSTSGKINMNYQIAPFTYIKRATAMYGAFKAEEPLVIPNEASKVYKLWDHETNDWPQFPDSSIAKDASVKTDWLKAFNGQAPFDKLRRPIDPVGTLQQADDRFSKGDIFRSATEICELHLVRQNEKLSDYTSGNIWEGALITGDNTRERPYTNLYAKLTTRSNVFTVHYRVQKLKKSSVGSAAQWDEVKDQVLGEYRGSTMIERYIDASDPTLPDFTTASGNLDNYYKFRVVSTKKFAP